MGATVITPIPNPAPELVIPDVDASVPPPYEVLRVRIGLPADDATRDADIDVAWQMAVEWAETFLNRYLRAGEYIEPFTHLAGDTISLSAYPIESVESITDENGVAIDAYHIEPRTGLLHLDGWRRYHQVSVNYIAGLPLASSLTLGLLQLFDAVWQASFGAAPGASTAAVKSTAIDGMRVEYDVSSDTGGMSSGTAQTQGMPASAAFLLSPFARLYA